MTNLLVNRMLATYFNSQPGHWLALHISDPTNAGLATTEVNAVTYNRQSVTWSPPSNRGVTNINNITFFGLPTLTIGYIGVWSLATGGDLLAVMKADPPFKTVSNGSSVYIPQNTLIVQLA